VKIFGIREVKLFRGADPFLQSRMVEAAFSLRIRISLENMLLELFKKQRVILIVLKE
jgi:hypothetical protein